jgi:carotenoid cleavage dioxygenase
MAHAFTMFPNAGSGYADGLKTDDGQVKFPATSYFQGPLLPTRIEGDVKELETTG